MAISAWFQGADRRRGAQSVHPQALILFVFVFVFVFVFWCQVLPALLFVFLVASANVHGQSTPALTKRLRAFSQKPVDVPTLCMGVSGA
ncbi:hypothetical protein AO961_08975 [Pseudomonas aeruginosa]|nr:hypothetical protein CGU46_10490 [Pseudomonas aeruginosa]ASP12813.1 hypothetical protein CGU45_16330 [Pseudomonas aeruginosa]KSF10681.1 hypothetical protein AO935_27745 [Pseudomonas aeruginosa]KSG77690.1 hypothetical protein AO961_08975 [Pseudomonas aeruginosa]OUM39227.1 hypothetical protein B8W76_00940 [Pseudomonas aeruginosa]